jgi:SAM-dependent methyltransferase
MADDPWPPRDRPPVHVDPERVRQETIAYYDRRPLTGDAWDSEPTGPLADVTAERAARERALLDTVAGRRVLELGCGTGSTTRVAAAVAASVLALDTGPSCIRLAREQSPGPHVDFQVTDAFALDHLPRDFTAGFAAGLFHLIPAAAQDAFLDGFHRRLIPGSPVFLSSTRTRTLRARRRLFPAVGVPDLISVRTLTDGSVYHVVNNELDEGDLRRILGARSSDLRVTVGDAWWWVTYRM